MLPIDTLMEEHRLIKRLIALIQKELDIIQKTGKANPLFIDNAVDFFKTYTDRTHHGKEEDILFREIGKKPVSDEHREILKQLLIDHVHGRKQVIALLEENNKYKNGDESAVKKMEEIMRDLCVFYPEHIQKEDKHFFVPVMDYFSEQEIKLMTDEFNEWDRTMIHEKYRNLVELFEKKE